MEQQINQLLYWQEEAERLRYDLSVQKQKAQQQEQAWRDREAFLLDCIEGQRGADAGAAGDKGSKNSNELPQGSSPLSPTPTVGNKPSETNVLRESAASPSSSSQVDNKEEGIVTQKNETGLIVVKAGVPSKLLERLLDPAFHDSHFMQTFMMTYRAFVETNTILNQIETICTLPQDKASTPSILKHF